MIKKNIQNKKYFLDFGILKNNFELNSTKTRNVFVYEFSESFGDLSQRHQYNHKCCIPHEEGDPIKYCPFYCKASKKETQKSCCDSSVEED